MSKSEQVRFDFSSRGVLVTGGAQGIGLEIAEEFLNAGARVALWDLDASALDTAKSALEKFAKEGRLTTTRVDVSDFDSCNAGAAALPFALHVLVNNAGITRDKTAAKMAVTDFAAVVQVNLNGAFHVVKATLEKFDAADLNKRVINMASVVALYGNVGQANYAAAKAGVIGMTKSLAREMGRKGFTVNAIAPGFIRTAMTAAMPPDVLAQVAARVPVGRLGEPRDVAALCLFLASSAAGYINGATLSVDGGLVG